METMNASQIATAIEVIRKSAATLHEDMHRVAWNCLAHIAEHGDTTLGTKLFNALPNSQRREALAYWFAEFSSSKAKFSEDKHRVWTCKLDSKRTADDFRLDEAAEVHFADLTKEKKPKTLELTDLIKMLKGLRDKEGMFTGTTIPRASESARKFAGIALEAVSEAAHLA